MPTKTKLMDRSVPGEMSYTRYLWNQPPYPLVTNYPAVLNGPDRYAFTSVKYRVWETTVGWKALRASQGYLATKPMTETQKSWTQQGPTVLFKHSNGIEWRYERGSFNSCPTQLDETWGGLTSFSRSQLLVDAQSKCLSKARDMKINIPVALGEGRQTVRMLGETARTLGRSYRNFRRGRFRQAARDLGIDKPVGTLANHWLAYSYGWSPLLSDAVGLVELAAQQLELGGRPPRISVKAISKLPSKEASVTVTNQGPVSLSPSGWDTVIDYKADYEGEAGLLLEVEFHATALAAQTGFGVYDIALTAWELTPFSFVFDWFVDIGGWLESASALQGMKVKTGYARSLEVSKGSSRYVNRTNLWIADGLTPTTRFTLRDYRRILWTGSITSIKSPMFDALNARRLITTASLWKQRTRGDRIPGRYRP